MSRRSPGRATKQILSGDQLAARPPERSTVPTPGFGGTLIQWYFLGLSALLLGAVLGWAIWGMGAASPLLFLLALGLIAAWLVI
ncbi:MAG: hypothetical protein KC442_23650 [Thermomicrobiales bacterium]|nr:hypothetical protein [Thermomicrobiales bacterium]